MKADEPGLSALAAVLEGRTAPGVYRWSAAYDVDHVRHTVELAGWRFAHLAGRDVATASEFHESIRSAMEFPDYYGRNLDALNDCLHDIELADERVVLLWEDWSRFARSDAAMFATAIGIMARWDEVLCVLLRGDGPDPGIPSLD